MLINTYLAFSLFVFVFFAIATLSQKGVHQTNDQIVVKKLTKTKQTKKNETKQTAEEINRQLLATKNACHGRL